MSAMRLYLYAESKNNIGYIPDWLRVKYKQYGSEYELILDIQGEIEYDKNCLNCRCKGDLIPWVLHDCETGDEIDLYELPEDGIEIVFPTKRIAEIICNGFDYEVGIYPFDDDKDLYLILGDKLNDCQGRIEIYVAEDKCEYTKEFNFNAELNSSI